MSTAMPPRSSAAAGLPTIRCSTHCAYKTMHSRSRDRRPAAFQILNQNGQPINCPPGGGNTCATTPWGTVDRTFTKALTTGASLQALSDDKVLGHNNNFVIGTSVDRSKIGF